MMKVLATLYKGIEFVRFLELPEDQQALLQFNAQVERINILIDGKIVSNCIQYKDYSAWYVSVFAKPAPAVQIFSQPVIIREPVLDRV